MLQLKQYSNEKNQKKLKVLDSKVAKPRLWTRSYLVILAINFLVSCGFHTSNSTLAVYVESLGASQVVVGVSMSLAMLGAILVRPLVGHFLDQHGRKAILFGGIFAMCISVAAIPFFPHLAAVLMLRCIQGMAFGAANTASGTILADALPSRRFGEGIGFFGLANSVSMALAPAFALSIYYASGIVFPMVLAAIALLVASLLALTLRYRHVALHNKGGIDGMELTVVETRGSTQRIRQPRIEAKGRLANLIELTSLTPAIMAFFTACTWGTVQTFGALSAKHLGIDSAPFFYAVIAVFMLVARPLFGRLVDKRGYHIPLVAGIILVTCGFVVMALMHNTAELMLGASILGVGFGALNPTFQTMAMVGVPYERRGMATATYFMGFDSGIGTGTIVAGSIAGLLGYQAMYFFCIAGPLISGLLFIRFGKATGSTTASTSARHEAP
jgi:MFS family permease